MIHGFILLGIKTIDYVVANQVGLWTATDNYVLNRGQFNQEKEISKPEIQL